MGCYFFRIKNWNECALYLALFDFFHKHTSVLRDEYKHDKCKQGTEETRE